MFEQATTALPAETEALKLSETSESWNSSAYLPSALLLTSSSAFCCLAAAVATVAEVTIACTVIWLTDWKLGQEA